MDELKIHSVEGTEIDYEVAGIGSRSYAFVIDWHIRILLAIAWWALLYLLFAITDIALNPVSFESVGFATQIGFYLYIVIPALLYFLYHPILEIVMEGRTPGKRMAGVRIISKTGHAPSIGQHLIRNIFRIIDSMPIFYGFGLFAALVTPYQVRIGDMAAGTLLVHEKAISESSLASAETEIKANSQIANEMGINAKQIEALQEIIIKWPTLKSIKRIQYASLFLKSIQHPLPQAQDNTELEGLLYAEIQAIYQKLH